MTESRHFSILYQLLEKGEMTAPELAASLEVSTRTIYRDVERLSQAGIPIYAVPGRGGGIALMEHFSLDRGLLSQPERLQLLASLQGLKSLAGVGDSQLMTKLEGLFRTAGPDWLELDFSDWRWQPEQKKSFALIQEGLIQRRRLSFDYLSGTGLLEPRKAEPQRLIFKSSNWYLAAFCCQKQAVRFFKVSRMRGCCLLDETFDRVCPAESLVMDWPREELQSLVLKFSPESAFRVYEEFAAQDIREEADGLYVTAQLPQHGSILAYLLSYLDQVEILEPADLRQEFGHQIQKILDKYKS